MLGLKSLAVILVMIGVVYGVTLAVASLSVESSYVVQGYSRQAVVGAIVKSLPWIAVGSILYLIARKKPRYWWPGQTELERRILDTVSRAEMKILYLKLLPPAVLFLVGAVLVVVSMLNENWFFVFGLAISLVGVHLGQNAYRAFLCATESGRQLGATPANLSKRT